MFELLLQTDLGLLLGSKILDRLVRGFLDGLWCLVSIMRSEAGSWRPYLVRSTLLVKVLLERLQVLNIVLVRILLLLELTLFIGL